MGSYISAIIRLNKVAFLEDSTFGQIKGDYTNRSGAPLAGYLNLNCPELTALTREKQKRSS